MFMTIVFDTSFFTNLLAIFQGIRMVQNPYQNPSIVTIEKSITALFYSETQLLLAGKIHSLILPNIEHLSLGEFQEVNLQACIR